MFKKMSYMLRLKLRLRLRIGGVKVKLEGGQKLAKCGLLLYKDD